MAATVTGALKAVVEAAGLSVAVYRDSVPQGAPRPYVVVYEDIAGDLTRLRLGDVRTTCQADLWQNLADERYDLALRIAAVIEHAVFPKVGTGGVYGIRPTAPRRIPVQSGDATVRYSMDLEVVRSLGV